MIKIAPKDPGATLKYALDFTDDLNGAAFTGAPVIAPDGVTLVSSDVSGNLVKMLLSGGTAGTVAKAAVTVTSDAGETLTALLVLPIGGEAVSLATAKAAQRIEIDDDDALLAGYLRAAIRRIEKRTSKNLTQQIEEQRVNGFPVAIGSARSAYSGSLLADSPIRLFKGPVSEILDVKYDDGAGVEQTLSDYRLIEGKDAKLLPAFGSCWPVTAFGPGTVRIRYIAGYDPTDRDLDDLVQAAILLFGHFNANREAVIASDRAAAVELPLGIEDIIASYCPVGIA